MQHSTTSEVTVAMSPKMPSAVVTVLLSAVLLAQCEYGNGFKLAITYNSELLKFCADLAFIVASMYVVLFCYFLFIIVLFNKAYNILHYIRWNDNE
jgi:hypothetical protein